MLLEMGDLRMLFKFLIFGIVQLFDLFKSLHSHFLSSEKLVSLNSKWIKHQNHHRSSYKMTKTVDYLKVAKDKRQSLLSKIPSEWRLSAIPTAEEQPNVNEYLSTIISAKEQEITSKSATELLSLLKTGKLSAYEITYAYCHRSALVHQLTDCLIEIFYDRALEKAQSLDEYYKKTGELVGPLHGIPISLKDQVNVPGITTSIGYLGPHISEENEIKVCDNKEYKKGGSKQDKHSLIAQILFDSGAIFYVKTTVPMAMLGAETSSNIGPPTVNSINRKLAPGGSSGGEASLLSGNGSVIGLGTDIGGSIRGPCATSGLFGLRASSNRFPYLGVSNSYANQIAVCSVIGPMCRYLEDLELVSKIIIESEPWNFDAKCVPVTWKDKVPTPENLKFGIMKWDAEIMPHPPILRCISELESKLSKAGYGTESIEKPPVSHLKLANLLTSIYTLDNFTDIANNCKLADEPFPPLLERSFTLPGKTDTVDEFFDKARLKYKYQQQYDDFFNDGEFDALIVPGWSSTSWKIGDNMKIGNPYTRYLNILDYSVLTIPVGKVSEVDIPYQRSDDEFGCAQDKVNWNYYDQDLVKGMPVVIQLVCKRYQEEKCINLAKLILNVLEN